MGAIREAGTHEMKSLWLWIALFLWFAIAFFRGYLRSRRRTAAAQGKVLRVRFGRLHLGTNVPRPEIEFVDSRGQRIEFHSQQGASWNPWPAGSTVQVYYDPEDPTNAEIKTTLGVILFSVGVGSVVILGLLYALLKEFWN